MPSADMSGTNARMGGTPASTRAWCSSRWESDWWSWAPDTASWCASAACLTASGSGTWAEVMASSAAAAQPQRRTDPGRGAGHRRRPWMRSGRRGVGCGGRQGAHLGCGLPQSLEAELLGRGDAADGLLQLRVRRDRIRDLGRHLVGQIAADVAGQQPDHRVAVHRTSTGHAPPPDRRCHTTAVLASRSWASLTSISEESCPAGQPKNRSRT